MRTDKEPKADTEMKDKLKIISFLKKNGFEKIELNSYANHCCNVVFEEETLAVANNDGAAIYNKKLCIFWLIGVLTYYGFLDKNWKK